MESPKRPEPGKVGRDCPHCDVGHDDIGELADHCSKCGSIMKRCKSCGRPVSHLTIKCPHCGKPA